MAKTSNCLQLIDRMPQQDQDAILARLDALQAKGLTAKEAQLQAAIDVLAQVEREGQARKSADRVTDTPAFKKWFGDSEVVDEYGQPLVVYHATNRSFDAFDTKRGELGSHFGPVEQANQVADAKQSNSNVVPAYLSIEKPLRLIDKGSFAADEVSQQLADMGLMTQAEADAIAKDIYDDGVPDSKLVARLQAAIRKAGYDGVVYLNRREGFNPFGPDGVDGATLNEMGDDEVMEMFPEAQDSWIAFQPTQIKSAIGNNGQFDPANPDIRKSVDRDANFKRWTRGLPVIKADFSGTYDGGPAVFQAYHGTTHTDITEFKNIGNKEGALGQGPYFSTSVNDVNENYAGVGPDLTSRIGREIDNVAQGFDDDAWYATDVLQAYFDDNGIDTEITDDNIEELKDEHRDKAIEHAATKALKGDSDGFVMPVYVRLEKPFNMATSPTYFEMTYPVNEDGEPDYEAEPEGSALDLINAINEVASGYNADADSLTSWVYENGTDGVSAREVWDRASKDMSELYDDNGEMISSGQFMQEVAREMGFDGLIQDADAYFGTQRRGFGGIRAGAMKGVEPGTLHIMPFDGAQVKSATGNSGEFGENREILKSAERIARTPEFTKWFGDSLVVNADGTPKVVFRGEHGANGGIDFQSRLASLSFGTSEVASAYAGEPNDSADIAEAPRLYPVYLRIENPLMNDPSDPFIELGYVADKLGMDVAESAARKFAPEIEGTGNWEENFADEYDSVDQLLDERPEAVRELYTLAWRFFDMPEFVNAAKKAGYDGAIHAEYGTHSENEEGAEYKVFDQAQVKSIFNKAPTNSRDITKSVDRPQFYSQLQRTIEGVPDRLATMAAPQWKLWLDSNGPKAGVKKDEIEWSGIKDYLDLQGKAKLSKDDLARYLDDSGVKVSEVIMGDSGYDESQLLESISQELFEDGYWEISASQQDRVVEVFDQRSANLGATTKYGKYTLPGGENYRELLITLPEDLGFKTFKAENGTWGIERKDGLKLDGWPTEQAAINSQKSFTLPGQYQSSHWDQKNVLAHIRINDRVTEGNGPYKVTVREGGGRSGSSSKKFDTLEAAQQFIEVKKAGGYRTELENLGKLKVLFVEEVQSDWGQDGLKKGFKPTPAQRAKTESRIAELSDQIQAIRDSGVNYPADGTPVSEIDPKFMELQKLMEERVTLQSAGRSEGNLPPPAPFVGKTEGWLNLALKRIAMLAVEGGYDKVAFVNGEQSADRYDLSKQISSISYEPGSKPENEGLLQAWDLNRKMVLSQMMTTDRIEDYVGKDVAVRLLETDKVMGKHLLDGENIKVGGKGMIKFYDEIVPQALNKLLPKIGGEKLGAVNIGSMDTKQGREGDALLAQLGIEVKGKRPPTQPGFDVTDKMRETVKQGLPLFSRDRFVQADKSELYQKRTAKDVGLISEKDAMAALETDATSVRIMEKGYQVKPGELVGARLNLNVLKNTKVPVMTLHKATNSEGYKKNRGFYRGEAVQYKPAVTLRNAYFNVDQTGRENIATGVQNKFPMASVDGEFVDAKPNFDGVEVSFNPARVHLFVDAKGRPVRSAEEISMFGTRAYARGKIEYYTEDTAPDRKGAAASEVRFSRDRAQTRTPEFQRWFGDSVVVDADGNPMVVYTGTSKDVDFKSFKIPKNGAWFTTDASVASAYALENDSMAIKTEDYRTFTNVNTASRVMPVYLRIEKMYTPTESEMAAMVRASNYKREQGNLFDRVRRDGFDGVDMGGGVFVVIKDPAQIKSAIGNDGGFDPSKKDITKSRDRKAPDTKEFKAWFGDSKVVNAKGEPLVVYRGVIGEMDGALNGESRDGYASFGSDSPHVASSYGNPDHWSETGAVIPLYIKANRLVEFPVSVDRYGTRRFDKLKFDREAQALQPGEVLVARQVIDIGPRASVSVDPEKLYSYYSDIYAWNKGTSVKSAVGNNGDFDGTSPDIRKSTARKPWFEDLSKLKVSTNYQLGDLLKTSRKLSWWDRTIGTQYNLAQKQPEFKRVFDAVQTFINDVSAYATRAADLAPTILPKLDGLKDIIKKPMSAEDVAALRDPVFGGTLKYARDENGEIYEEDDVQKAGVVFTDEELKSLFKLSDAQIGLYRQFRSSVDQSVTDLALSDMIRYLGEDGRDIAETVMASGNVDVAVGVIESHLADLAKSTPQRAETLAATTEAIQQKGEQANRLMDRGYAPLSRFGQFTTYVVGKDGEQLYFGMFENERDAQKMAREMREQYPDATVSTSTMSQESYKLFSGVTPETLALFGESLGLEESGIDTKSEVFQQYLKVAKTNRSAMKRLIQRKGVNGFSEDAGRVLAGFVYSNARQISTNLHAGEIGKAAADVKDGDVKDAAIRLMEYIQNPQEEAQAIRGLMFTQFIGGSIASALVNMTQPFTMTAPYLAQFDGATGAAKRMADAMKLATKGVRNDADLKDALKRAEDLGIVSPQEVHQLMAQARGKGSLITGDGTKVGDAAAKANNFTAKLGLAWGKAFSAAEQFNRRITFIAAYKLARDQGMADPMAFAEKTIAETQGVYNKGNKPAWARGAIGGTLFTFKQYSISYVEFLQRMWGNGPEGKKAVGLALGVLFMSAGLGGMPGADDLDDVIDGFAQRVLGKSFDSKQAKKEFFASILGQAGAEFVMGGLTGLPGAPIDLSGRLGLGNLIPGTGLLTKKSDYSRDTAEIFGPAGSLFKQVATGAGKLVQGDATGALKEVAPVAVQNVIKGVDMATMGMYRDTKGRKVIDTDPWEAVAKAVGFQPSSVKRVQDATGTQQNLIGQNKLREAEIADKWAAGRIERNPSKVEEAKAELAEWNRKNPQSPISIDASQINRRVQQAMMDKAKRLEKTAPKEIRESVKRELERASN